MLTIKNKLISPTKVVTIAFRKKNPILCKENAAFGNSSQTKVQVPRKKPAVNFNHGFGIFRPHNITAAYLCTKNAKESGTSTPTTNAPPVNTSSIVSSVDKSRVEKTFFRFLALFLDYTLWLYTMFKKRYERHVLSSPAVQMYIKQLQDKIAKPKRE